MFSRKRVPDLTRHATSSQPRSVDEALIACQRVFDDGLRDEDNWDGVRERVVALGHIARRQNVAPERMLADFKQMLSGLPALHDMDPPEKTNVIERLVTLSIEAYYEETQPT